MRLIDADVLNRELAEFVAPANRSDFEPIPTWNDAVSLVGSAPTVEAIPVEWIRNLQDKFYEKSEWLIVAAVGAIIEDWQKEQRKEE